MLNIDFKNINNSINKITNKSSEGIITKVVGITLEAKGFKGAIGEICQVYNNKNQKLKCEIVGFKDNIVLLMALGELGGISPGCKVVHQGETLEVKCSDELLGKVLNGLGEIVDNTTIKNYVTYPLDNTPPNPLKRKIISDVLVTGVRAIDSLLTCGKGIRIGIFAGSGVGKSTTMGMIAREARADVNVICLVGERGREVLEFIKNDLGEEGLKKSVIVCATSDQPALVRVKSALTGTAIAEYFRDQGKDVILMMDSVTRFAMAQREVGLAIGEVPAQKGYTPSVFSMLPKLMERTGTSDNGTISAFYTVLVDGDDFNEPISDAVRGILDGHIILSRDLAAKNHYPAIDVLPSISRIMSSIVTDEHKKAAGEVRNLLAVYKESEDLIKIGAYKNGTSKEIDKAIKYNDLINNFLIQKVIEKSSFEDTTNTLLKLINI